MNPAHAHDAQSKRDIRTAPTGEAAPGREHEARGEGGDDGREAKDAAPALLTAGRASSPGGGGQEGRPRGGSLTLRGGGARGRQVVLCAGVGGGERSSLSFLTHDDLRAYAYEGDASPSGSLTSTVMGLRTRSVEEGSVKPLLVEYEEVLGLLNDLPDASRPPQIPQIPRPPPEAEEVFPKATMTTSKDPTAVATSEDKATPLNNSNGKRDAHAGSLTSRAARKGWKNVFPFR